MIKLPETALLAASNAALALATWVIVALLARNEGLEVVGAFGLALAIFAPIVFALAADARIRIGSGTHKSVVRDMYMLRLFLQLIILVVVVAIVVFFEMDRQVASIMFAVYCLRAVESNFDFSYGLWVAEQRMLRVAVSQFTRSLISIIVTYVLLKNGFSATVCVLGIAGGQCVMLIPGMWKIFYTDSSDGHGSSGSKQTIAVLVETFVSEFRVSLYAALASINGSAPRYLLATVGNLEVLGLFTIYLQFFAAGTTVSTAMNLAFSRAVGLDMRRESAQTVLAGRRSPAARQLIFSTALLGLLLLVCSTAFAPLLLDIVFDLTRPDARFEVGLIMVAALFAYTGAAASSLLLYRGDIRFLVIVLVTSLLVLLVCFYFAILLGVSPLIAVSVAMIANRFCLSASSVLRGGI